MSNLDLVITVDTAIAHLAGSLGIPVWTLLPFFPDWRWLRDAIGYAMVSDDEAVSTGGSWRVEGCDIECGKRACTGHSTERLTGRIRLGEWRREEATASSESLFNEAHRLQQAGSLIEAVETYRRLLHHASDHSGARNNLAVCLQNEGRIEEAMEQCREALRCAPAKCAGAQQPRVCSS